MHATAGSGSLRWPLGLPQPPTAGRAVDGSSEMAANPIYRATRALAAGLIAATTLLLGGCTTTGLLLGAAGIATDTA